MAAVGLSVKESSANLTLNDENIESEIAKRMNWNRREWEEEGEAGASLKKLINSMRYWYKKLSNAICDKSLVITLFDTEGEARVNVLEIVDAIIQLGYGKEIEGFSDFRNPRYLAFHFTSADIKNLVEKELRKVGNTLVVYLHWALQPELINVKAHWLPMGHDLKNIQNIIGEVIDIAEIKKEKMTLMSGMDLKRGLLTFYGKLKKGKTVEMLPHIVIVDGFECLVTTYGRDPLCLTCNVVGHRSASCPTPFCKSCNSLHGKKEKCNSSSDNRFSYAGVLKNGKNDEDSTAASMEGCDQTNLDGQSDTNMMKPELNKTHILNGKSHGNDNDVSKGNIKSESWASHEISDSDSYLSEEDDSVRSEKINIKEIFNKTSNYFLELQKLNDTDVLNNKEVPGGSDFKPLDNKLEHIEEMDVSDKNLKRKIANSKQSTKEASNSRGPGAVRRTYSKSKPIVTGSINTASNLFDVLRDRGDERK